MDLKKLKFPRKTEFSFINHLRGSINEYFVEEMITRYGNANMVLKTVFMISLYFIPYGLMISGIFQSVWPVVICWIVMGFGMAGIGLSIMHDANHMSYSSNRTVNRYLGYMLNLIGGFAPTWKIQHNTLHHGYTNIDGFDEDIDPGKVLRLSPSKPRYRIHRFQHLYAWFLYGLMTFTWVIDKDFGQLNRYRKEGLLKLQSKSYRRLFAELVISKIVYYAYIILIPILLLPIPWWWVPILFFIMHFIGGLTLGTVFQAAHVVPTSEYPMPDEDGNLKNNWAMHQMLTTANFSPKSRIFSWYIGGLNYQIEHHLFPNICHVHYRKISSIVKQAASDFGIPYNVQPSFVKAVWSHGKMLKQLGRYN
jgi:linoleoyl-CoA desaturase